MDKISGCLLTCLVTAIVLTAIDFLWAWLLRLLWNGLVPAVFHGPVLTYWQAFIAVWLLSFIGGFFKSSASKEEN